MKIYVASSWRNEQQPHVVEVLREDGHDVYDFRNPRPGDHGFHWSEIDEDWKHWDPVRYRDALDHHIAVSGFESDMQALRESDAVVAVQPFGRSASLELGWACGAGKRTFLLLADGEPELMVKMVDHVCCSIHEIRHELDWIETSRGLVAEMRGAR